MLIDGILATLVVFLVLELLICITAMLFGLTVLAARRTQVVTSRGLPFRRHLSFLGIAKPLSLSGCYFSFFWSFRLRVSDLATHRPTPHHRPHFRLCGQLPQLQQSALHPRYHTHTHTDTFTHTHT